MPLAEQKSVLSTELLLGTIKITLEKSKDNVSTPLALPSPSVLQALSKRKFFEETYNAQMLLRTLRNGSTRFRDGRQWDSSLRP